MTFDPLYNPMLSYYLLLIDYIFHKEIRIVSYQLYQGKTNISLV